jgi:hypothetical protein
MFHWDNTSVHTAAKVTDWMVARDIKLIENLPFLPDFAQANFFSFPKVKRELAVLTLTLNMFKKEWEGAVQSIVVADFAKVFRQ